MSQFSKTNVTGNKIAVAGHCELVALVFDVCTAFVSISLIQSVTV